MTDERLDRWRDQMVAALYDELPPDERTELEAELARSPELEREWRELQATRAWLQEAAEADTGAADLEVVLPPKAAPRAWWQRPAVTAGAGFAAAASLFVALLLAGLRVDATDGGLLVRFASPETATVATDGAPVGPEVVARGGEPVTREEFARFADLLVQATSAQLDDLERRQSASQVQLVGALYDALAVDQRRQYDDLRTRLDAAMLQASLNEAAGAPGDRR